MYIYAKMNFWTLRLTGLVLLAARLFDTRGHFGNERRLAAVAGEIGQRGAAVIGHGAEKTLQLM